MDRLKNPISKELSDGIIKALKLETEPEHVRREGLPKQAVSKK